MGRHGSCWIVFSTCILSVTALADYPEASVLDAAEVIEVVTRDTDGDRRQTKVWVVLVDGDAYLRTNGSVWLENLRRDPELLLFVEGSEFEAQAEEIPSDVILEKVDRASQKKYGWQESLIHPFRTKRPEILKLTPRSGPAPGAPR